MRSRSPCRSRVVLSFPTLVTPTDRHTSRPTARPVRSPSLVRHRGAPWRSTRVRGDGSYSRCDRISERLPNTRCEVGILKTVEFLANRYEAETFVPDRRVTLSVLVPHNADGTIVLAGPALAVRLSAGHLYTRHSENRGEDDFSHRFCNFSRHIRVISHTFGFDVTDTLSHIYSLVDLYVPTVERPCSDQQEKNESPGSAGSRSRSRT